MQANPVIAGAFEASATIIAYSAAVISLSGTVSASKSLTLTGVASATLASAGDIDIAVASIAFGDPACPADVSIGPVYAPPEPRLVNPQFSYADGRLARIDYDGPHAKIFAYQNGRLATLDYSDGFRTRRKNFVYDASGALASIAEGFV